ncbi:hypothetical protein QVD17_02059 [Tagetes erecta]|uniref:SANTA domain-containing protein n=1 Tax=Tagetes erecta TaxID=13708 RepID=A0AAD8L5W7_TARER|nr:hypothetical protein QVD17_02059 [Tagetes erecta]
MTNLFSESKTPISSSRRKLVFLRKWWLIKVENETKLGVGGLISRETLGTRGMRLLGSASTGKRPNTSANEDEIQVYGSAAIAKRHDSTTIEAVDGIIIQISGFINKLRTLSHGFSPEVCDGFLFGFPCTWEDYASNISQDECANTTKQSLYVSFDDLPVARVRDLLMSESESRALTSIIVRDILKHAEKSLDQSVSPNNVSKNSTETKVDHKQDEVVSVSLSNSTQKVIKEEYKIPVDSHLENCKETEDVCMLDELNDITQEKQSKELARRYPLRSTRKRART